MDRNVQRARRSSAPVRNVGVGGAVIISSFILGVCMIIAGSAVSGSVKKLTETVEKKEFASSYTAPSNLSVREPGQRQYMNVKESAEYLGVTPAIIEKAIDDGRINEYIKVGDDYSISVKELDEFFGEQAYREYMEKSGD